MSTSSKASVPTKAGDVPANVKPNVSYHDVAAVALTQIDALMRGGADAVCYIAAALLIGYLDQKGASGKGTKLSVIKDEFALMLKKKGLGATQTGKYLDYAQTLAAKMFKECAYGMEMAALLAATKPEKAHDAVTAYVSRHTIGKKTEHGFKLSETLTKLNVMAIWLGKEEDPAKPETLENTPEASAAKTQREQKARKALAERIGKDPAVLSEVSTERLVETVAKVVTFDALVVRHVLTVTTVDALEKEFTAIKKAYTDRIAEMRKDLGTKAGKAKETKAAKSQINKAA